MVRGPDGELGAELIRPGETPCFRGAMAAHASPRPFLFVVPMPPADLQVQIFGTKKSADTRKALRFFAERRVKTHFVDLAERAASLGELKRFAQKFGVEAILDRESKRFADLGLRTALYGEEKWLSILAEEPYLLKQPLVRLQHKLCVGVDEKLFKEWLG